MTPEQRAASVMAQSVYVMGELYAMQTTNQERDRKGLAQAYTEEAFDKVIGKIRSDIIEQFQIGNSISLP